MTEEAIDVQNQSEARVVPSGSSSVFNGAVARFSLPLLESWRLTQTLSLHTALTQHSHSPHRLTLNDFCLLPMSIMSMTTMSDRSGGHISSINLSGP